jgi:hypothetical protein
MALSKKVKQVGDTKLDVLSRELSMLELTLSDIQNSGFTEHMNGVILQIEDVKRKINIEKLKQN